MHFDKFIDHLMKLLILGSITFNWSCNSNTDPVLNGFDYVGFEGFPEAKEVKGIDLEIHGTFYWPIALDKFDSLLIVVDPRNQESMILLIDLNSKSTIAGFGEKGIGKGELFGANAVFSSNGKSVLAHDIQAQRLYEFPIDSILHITNYKPDTFEITRFEDRIQSRILKPISDSSFLVELLPALNARFGLVDSNLKRILTFGKFPPIERKGNNSPTKNAVVVDGNLFQGRMEIANKKLYFAHSFVDLISVYNIEDGSNVLNILGPEKNLPPSYVLTDNGIGVPSKDSKNAYGSIRVTTRFIYALYSGLQSNDREGYLCSNIYKFDLAGNPIARFELDKDLTDFIIDEENNLIYAVQPFGDTPLVTFDYSDFEQ